MPTMKIIAACAMLAAPALCEAAQAPIAYPAKGQSQARQDKDDGECHVWAKNKTGVDPAVASSPPPQETGSTLGGGERTRDLKVRSQRKLTPDSHHSHGLSSLYS